MHVACILIKNFPVRAESQRCPKLYGKPIIIIKNVGSHQTVVDCSPEIGPITLGMSLQEALSRCRNAVLIQADPRYYYELFDSIIISLTSISPEVQKQKLGCVYLNLDGLQSIYEEKSDLIFALSQAIPQALHPSIGIAPNKFTAYLSALLSLGEKNIGILEEERVGAFLKNLSIDFLPLPQNNRIYLHRLGIHRMGQLAALNIGPIQAQLGPEGKTAWQLASGMDYSPLIPYKPRESINEYLELPSPTTTLNTVLIAIEIVLDNLFSQPKLRGRYIRTATLELGVLHGITWVRKFAFKAPIGNKDKMLYALKNSLENSTFEGPLENVKITLSDLTAAYGIQASLFSDVQRQEQLRQIISQLHMKINNDTAIYKIKDIEPWSRIPERRHALVPLNH